jgi:O-antigen ligase
MVVLSTATVMFLVGLIGLAIDETALENEAVAGIVERFMSIFTVEDTLETNSLLWRAFENQEAWKSIWKRPLTGVGLGGSYRPVTVFQGEAQGAWTDDDISYKRIDRFTRYVHSSYFAITVKMGIPALLIFLSFLLAAVVKSIDLHRYLPDSMAKGLTIAIAVGIVGLMQWSLLHAHLILASSTAVIGLMLGIVASIHYLYVSHPQNYTIF